jgi:hypothetical protein
MTRKYIKIDIKFFKIAVKYTKVAINYTKRPQSRYVYQKGLKIHTPKYPVPRLSNIDQNWDFRFLNICTIWKPCCTVHKDLFRGVQGCQMVYFKTKNPNSGILWRALEWKMLVYLITIRNVLRPFGIIYGRLV